MKTLFGKALLATALAASTALPLHAARLFACASYSPSGQPGDVYETWEVPPAGASVYFLHRTENSPRELPQSLALRWRPLNARATDFKAYDRIYNYVETGGDWRAFDYAFKEEGIYECSTLNEAGQVLATATVTIRRAKDATLGRAALTACRDVTETGDAVGAGIDFKLAPSGGIYALFTTDNAFGTDRIGFELWQLDDFGYETYLDSRQFDCRTSWNYFKMPVSFPSEGRYRIKVFLGSNSTDILAEQLVRIKF